MSWCWGQLTADEKRGLEEALYLGNMTLKDLEFERKAFSDPFRMPLVNLSLDKPIETSAVLMGLHQDSMGQSLSKLLMAASEKGFGESQRIPLATSPIPPADDVPAELRSSVGLLVADMLFASSEIRAATEKLTPEERRQLIESLPAWAVEEPRVKFDFVRSTPLPQRSILALLNRVNLPRIRRAAVYLAEAVERTIPALNRTPTTLQGRIKTRMGGMTVVVAGKGNDTHPDSDAALVIDLGGDDTYTGRAGAGIGYASVLIDLGGQDRYQVPDGSIGAGILGVGLAYDFGGDETFRGGALTFGAGLAGVGAFIKTGGNNWYESSVLTQGFGQLGIGILLDQSGRDRYDCQLFGQGAARTQGVGWLIDRGGSDSYRAGGLSLNSPLFTGVHYSFAQGFASGYREDTGGLSGGIGLLTDHSGDDFYLSETYAQAASYWFSCGSLWDASGNDAYVGHHYVQSSAMHLCSTYLFDLAGDDGYMTKVGASHAIGHDYGVAMFLDRQGNDLYFSKDSTPGVGNANGLAIFLDAQGEDRYQGPPGKGNAARGSGSLGVFVDLGGQDVYRVGLADGQGAVTDSWGVALDQPDALDRLISGPQPPEVKPVPGSKPRPSDAELEQIYRRATQWGVGSAQNEVAEQTRLLIEIGMPAWEWMLRTHLRTSNRLQQRAFVAVIQGIGEPARRALLPFLLSDQDDEARNALGVASDAAVFEAAPAVATLLQRPTLQRSAARAAGVLRARECVNPLQPLVASSDRLLALTAMISLAQIGDEAAYGTAEAVLRQGELPMRKAALDLIVKFPARAQQSATLLALEDSERLVRLGLEIWARVGNSESLQELGKRLLDPRPGVRIQALLGLNGRCPAEYRATLLGLRQDPVPAVQAVAQRVDPGR
ncbi:MAG TPA: hypothetical protein PLO61_07965 [Fimbriimonadaceae bacterium]|nr:hypothetical protein [Fimbriimonadaceae bacterium]